MKKRAGTYFNSHLYGCVAVCCSVLQCVAVCCSVLHCVVTEYNGKEHELICSFTYTQGNVLQCVAVCCSVLQ